MAQFLKGRELVILYKTNSVKLVDGTGREVYFYQLTGCWGNAPFNYQAILAKQQ